MKWKTIEFGGGDYTRGFSVIIDNKNISFIVFGKAENISKLDSSKWDKPISIDPIPDIGLFKLNADLPSVWPRKGKAYIYYNNELMHTYIPNEYYK